MQLRIFQNFRVAVARRLGLLQRHFHRTHMRHRVAVGVVISLDGEMRQIALAQSIGFFVGFRPAGQERRKGKIINRALTRIVSRTGQIIGAFARAHRGLYFRPDHQHNIQAGLDGLDRVHNPDPARSASRLDARKANA